MHVARLVLESRHLLPAEGEPSAPGDPPTSWQERGADGREVANASAGREQGPSETEHRGVRCPVAANTCCDLLTQEPSRRSVGENIKCYTHRTVLCGVRGVRRAAGALRGPPLSSWLHRFLEDSACAVPPFTCRSVAWENLSACEHTHARTFP